MQLAVIMLRSAPRGIAAGSVTDACSALINMRLYGDCRRFRNADRSMRHHQHAGGLHKTRVATVPPIPPQHPVRAASHVAATPHVASGSPGSHLERATLRFAGP